MSKKRPKKRAVYRPKTKADRERMSSANRVGGRARMEDLTEEQRREFAVSGAAARIKSQSPEERSAVARAAAKARWAKKRAEEAAAQKVGSATEAGKSKPRRRAAI